MTPKSRVKRLTPTPETIRRLFLLSGNQCAYPGCQHPIILYDGQYVGELCHICAAEEGGERFDENQSNEDRRQFDNLMLMCHDHHVLTNDVIEYSPDRMRRIKADHERRFAAGLACMIDSADAIHIENSNISLGGEGGKAPGAGGGGGGVIGSNAIAGRGGDGGRLFIQYHDDLKIDVTNIGYPKEARSFIDSMLNFLDSVPGAGGAGAGAIGDHARGGDGGHGGDIVAGKMTVQPGAYRFVVGAGGDAAILPGQHGFPGGATQMLDPNGKIIASSAGGRRVKSVSSHLPKGVRELSHDDVRQGVRIPLLAPTNLAEIRNGLFSLQGAGWDHFEVPTLPYDSIWDVVGSIQMESSIEKLGIFIGLVNPAGNEMACQAIVLPENLRTIHFATKIGAKLDTLGLWKIVCYSGAYILAEYTVEVRSPGYSND